MNLINLFSSEGTPSTLLFLSLVGVLGVLLGKVNFVKIKLGIAGVLFTGILVGHFGASVDKHVLHFVKEFGLILFVYSIGLEVGPRFISSLKNNGLKLNMLAASVVLLGFGIAIIIKVVFDIPAHVIAGIMSGAVTNTPGLGAAQQVIAEQFNDPSFSAVTGMGYAVAYPFGIIGIIITMFLIRGFFKIKVDKEVEAYNKGVIDVSGKLEAVNLKLENNAVIGKDIAFLKQTLQGEFVVSRLLRNGDFIIPKDDMNLIEGDVVYGVSTKDCFDQLKLKVGELNPTNDRLVSGQLGMKHVVFTNKKLAGKSIKQIGLSRQFPVNITRIYRAGNELMVQENDTVEFGDTLRIVGERNVLSEAGKVLGNSVKELSHPNVIPVLLGIFAGVLIGSIPFAIPGLPAPAKLGLAGGPLLVALFLGHKGRIGKLDFYMTPSSNMFIRELGIILFLSCVGLSAGKHFVSTIVEGGYIWMLYGVAITLLPLVIVGIVARYLKVNYLTICGLLSGSMTDPPALEFANTIAPVQAQATAYATVYPLVMFLRVLLAQVLVLLFI